MTKRVNSIFHDGKFCEHCGKPLLEYLGWTSFDSETGELIEHYKTKCTNILESERTTIFGKTKVKTNCLGWRI